MFDKVLDTPRSNNFLQLEKGLRRSFPPLGLSKRILDSPYLLIPLIDTKSKKMQSWTHPASSFVSNSRNKKTNTQNIISFAHDHLTFGSH